MTQNVEGSDLMIFVDNKSIALATSCKLGISVETVETSSKDSGGKWATKKAKKISWNLSTENLFAAESTEGSVFNDMFKKVVGTNEFEAIFTTANEAQDIVPEAGWTPKANTGYKGKVVITSMEVNAPNGDNATYSVSFEGTGPLEEILPA